MRKLLAPVILALAAAALGCPRSSSSSAATPVEPNADWPDAAPMPDFREPPADAAPASDAATDIDAGDGAETE